MHAATIYVSSDVFEREREHHMVLLLWKGRVPSVTVCTER